MLQMQKEFSSHMTMCLPPRPSLRTALILLLLHLVPFRGAKCRMTGLQQVLPMEEQGTDVLESTRNNLRRAVVISELSKWPGGILPYTISDTLDESGKEAVAAAINAYTVQTCIQIKPWKGERDYVTFTRGQSCSSSIGRTGLQQFIYISPDCEVAGKVMHEIYHTLGRWHEHCRPDRDQYIMINTQNIIKSEKQEFTPVSSTRATVQGIPYDYDSIMHYEATAFSFNGLPTILPLNQSVSLDRLGQRQNFSPLDLQHLDILYCGGWGQWTPWGPCSVECGGGTRRRSKPCASKELCGGDQVQVEHCNLGPCPVWSDWTGWTQCNVSCGHGYQNRTRVCLNGTSCTGDSVDTTPCLATLCLSSGTSAVVIQTTSVSAVLSTSVPAVKSTSVPAVKSTAVISTSVPAVASTHTKDMTSSGVMVSTTRSTPVTPSASQPDWLPTPTPVVGIPPQVGASQWSLCSRSCGGGTQFRTTSQGMEHRSCNTQPCITLGCQQNAQPCSTDPCLLGLKNQECYNNGGALEDTTNGTMAFYPLNLTSQGVGSFLLQCASLALSVGYSSFAVIAEQCYLGNRSLPDTKDVPSNCTKRTCIQQGGTAAGCFYEITDELLLKRSVENVLACRADYCHGNGVCSDAIQKSYHLLMVAIVALSLISRLL